MLKKLFGIFLALIFCGMTYNAEAIVNDKRPVLVGFSYLQQTPITKAMLDGAKAATKKLKAKLIVRDGRGDQEIQMAQIHDLIAQETGCLVIVFDDIVANGRVAESGKNTGTPIVLVEGRQPNTQAAHNAAYKAVEEAWNKVKTKAVKPSFYNGY